MIPTKTIERLIILKTILQKLLDTKTPYVFSRELSKLSGYSAAQIRRDLMSVGYAGNPKNGYDVSGLFTQIEKLLQTKTTSSMILVGVGNLGRAVLNHFSRLQPNFTIRAAFDNDISKIDREISGAPVYHISQITEVLKHETIDIGIITVPESDAQSIATMLVASGIKGLINFSSEPVHVPEGIYLENINISMTFKKVAYFARMLRQEEES